MKKLMTLMLGLSFVLGSVVVSFAQDSKDDKMATTPRRQEEEEGPQEEHHRRAQGLILVWRTTGNAA